MPTEVIGRIVPKPLHGDVVLYASREASRTYRVAWSIGVLWKKSPLIGVAISHVTVLREVQFLKQSSPKLVTEDGMSMDVRDSHLKKQPLPKLVTEDGMVTDVREEQLEKQYHPNLVTEDGMSMDVREEQPKKQ